MNLVHVQRVDLLKFALTDQTRADVLRTNVWPPREQPQIWFYDPYPVTEENIPLVGERYLMNVWRDTHHADAAAYQEI